MLKLMRFSLALALVAVPALSAAQSAPADDEPHGPRPEAVAACKDKSEGDVCAFDGPHHHVEGTCKKDHAGELACFHPHHHHDAGAP
jgi:hypothetical protein